LITRETVIVPTPAKAATSRILAGRLNPGNSYLVEVLWPVVFSCIRPVESVAHA